MNGTAIAGAAIARGGLGALADAYPWARPDRIRLDAALAVAGGEGPARIGPAAPAVAEAETRTARP